MALAGRFRVECRRLEGQLQSHRLHQLYKELIVHRNQHRICL